MRGSLLFGVLALAGSGCVGNLGGDNRSGPSLGAETRPYCVSDYGHWHFWAECAEDVPLAPGDVVTSVSRGRVVSVYGSCGGAAGSGVRVDEARRVRQRRLPSHPRQELVQQLLRHVAAVRYLLAAALAALRVVVVLFHGRFLLSEGARPRTQNS